jgi:hypothetical protein
MDRQLRAEIVNTVNRAVMEANEMYQERWLTDEMLCEHVGVFTKRWLKDNGQMLPRTRAEWSDDKGEHRTAWLYPLHKIQRMIASGEIKRLTQ